jgi:3-oxoacyl-[acyl-carrier protein] reductase
MLEGLDGKVALVTGAGQGLGRSHALELAKHGVRVVVNDLGATLTGERTESEAHDVVDEIKAAGGEAVVNGGDVSNWDDAKAMVQQAIDTYGSFDILVNNAGVLRDRMIFNMSEEDFDLVVKVHLKGHFCTMRHAVAYWRDKAKAGDGSAYGRVISTTSEAAMIASPGQPNYSPAKAGIIQLTLSTAQVMAKYGVTCNAIAPRARTRMTQTLGSFDQSAGGVDLFATENVSPIVAYLASPASAKVSGQVFVVWGKEITLMRGPAIDEVFTTEEPWTAEGVDAALTPVYDKREFLMQGFILKY